MRRLFWLLMFLPAFVTAQGLATAKPGIGGGKVLASFPFSTTGCLATGTGGVNITRATKGTVNANGDGYTLTECQNNEYRVSTDGLLVEPARTNYAFQSNTMSTGTASTPPWSLSNATVETVAGAPMGGTWAEVTTTTNTGSIRLSGGTIASTTTPTFSIWMTKASGSGPAGMLVGQLGCAPSACSCFRSDGAACSASVASTHYCLLKIADLTTTPIRASVGATCTAAIATTYVEMYGGEVGVSTGTTRFSGAQVEVGTYPTSLIVTAGTAVARNDDAISATVPAVPSKWCIAVTAKPEENATWAAIAAYRIWSLGAQGVAGAAHWLNSGFMTYDQTAASKTLAWTSPTSGEVRGVFCNTAGVLSATTTGGTVGGLSGAGTSLANPWQTTMYIGQRSTGTPYFSGYLKNLKICAAKSAKECK